MYCTNALFACSPTIKYDVDNLCMPLILPVASPTPSSAPTTPAPTMPTPTPGPPVWQVNHQVKTTGCSQTTRTWCHTPRRPPTCATSRSACTAGCGRTCGAPTPSSPPAGGQFITFEMQYFYGRTAAIDKRIGGIRGQGGSKSVADKAAHKGGGRGPGGVRPAMMWRNCKPVDRSCTRLISCNINSLQYAWRQSRCKFRTPAFSPKKTAHTGHRRTRNGWTSSLPPCWRVTFRQLVLESNLVDVLTALHDTAGKKSRDQRPFDLQSPTNVFMTLVTMFPVQPFTSTYNAAFIVSSVPRSRCPRCAGE